jgi:hypothetical protein
MSDMSEFFGLLNAAAGDHAAGALQFVLGEVESWDPAQGTVVVMTKPGDNLTGDIPFMTPCVGAKGPDGKASGMQWGPAKGTPVVVFTTDSAQEHLYAMAQHYNDVFPSPGALEGEWWIRHKDGAYVKLLNDGRVVIGSTTYVDISDTTAPLGDDDCIVRRADLQAVIDKLNALTNWCRDHTHPGTAPAILPYPLGPLTIPQWCPDATASARGRAKGE